MSTPAPTIQQIESKLRHLAHDPEIAEMPAFQLGVCEELLREAHDILGRWRDAIDADERKELDHLTEEHFRRFILPPPTAA